MTPLMNYFLNYSNKIIQTLNDNPEADLNQELIEQTLDLESTLKEITGINFKFYYSKKIESIFETMFDLTMVDELNEYLSSNKVFPIITNYDVISEKIQDLQFLTGLKDVIDTYKIVEVKPFNFVTNTNDTVLIIINPLELGYYKFTSLQLAAIFIRILGEIMGYFKLLEQNINDLSNKLELLILRAKGKITREELIHKLNINSDNNVDLIYMLIKNTFPNKQEFLDSINEYAMNLLIANDSAGYYAEIMTKYGKRNIGLVDKNRLFIVSEIVKGILTVIYYILVGMVSVLILTPIIGFIIVAVGILVLKIAKYVISWIIDVMMENFSIIFLGRLTNKYEKIAKELYRIKQHVVALIRNNRLEEPFKKQALLVLNNLDSLLNEYPKLKLENQYSFTEEGITKLMNEKLKELQDNDLYILNMKITNKE